MNTQSDKKRKNKIVTFFWGMVILLAGGGLLARNSFGKEVEGPAIMFLFALSSIVFAIWSKKNWWAIIPGGIFASIGLVAGLEALIPHEEFSSPPFTVHWGVYSWVMFLGLAVTFGVLWLLRKTQPTDWAKYPATGLAVIAVQCLILGSRFQETCMITGIVAIGAMLMLALPLPQLSP